MLKENEITNNKNLYIEKLRNTKRDNIDNLIEYINATDFFNAPASTKYHSNFEGGLCLHSLLVSDLLHEKKMRFQYDIPDSSIDIIALLHDLCKADVYRKTFKNVIVGEEIKYGKPFKKWDQVEQWNFEDNLPFGHGTKSVILIQNFIKLSKLETACIIHHMGKPEGGFQETSAYNKAIELFPFLILMHTADYEASIFLEQSNKI